MKNIFLIALVVSFGFSIAAAQTPDLPAVPKTISKGIVNGSAVLLVKPEYPPAAKAVNASGTVSVQVTIDEEGNIISAQATNGHPLLQSAAVEAAKKSKFKPTLLQEVPVKVTGIIVYNFVKSMTLTQISYELGLAESAKSWRMTTANSITSTLPREWAEEREILQRLSDYLELQNSEPVQKTSTAVLPPVQTPPADKDKSFGVEKFKLGSINVAGTSAPPPTKNYSLDAAAIELIRELQTKIESRLNANQQSLWSVKFSNVLGETSGAVDDLAQTRANLEKLNQLVTSSPVAISESISSKLRQITESFQQTTPGDAAKEELKTFIESLRR